MIGHFTSQKHSKFKLFILCSLFTLAGSVVFSLVRVQHVAAVGELSNSIPNNGSPAVPWLVVTRPGSNGMDGPSQTIAAYVPTSLNTFTFTIVDACDNTTNDEQGGNNNTIFSISNAGNVSSPQVAVSGYDNDGNGSPEFWTAACTNSTSVTFTATGLTGNAVVNLNNGGVSYNKVILNAQIVDPNTAYYVNRFRYVTGTPGVLFGYAANKAGPGTVSAGYTGIAYNDASSGWGWNTQITFAQPCSTPGPETGQYVWFFDTDFSGGTTSSSPFWQNTTNGRDMHWSLEAFRRSDGVYINTPYSGFLHQGNDLPDAAGPLTLDPANYYRITVDSVNYVNSIQIAIPYEQIYAHDTCKNITGPPSCEITSITNMADGTDIHPNENFKFSVTTYNADGYMLGVNGQGYGGVGQYNNFLVSGRELLRKSVNTVPVGAAYTVVTDYLYAPDSPPDDGVTGTIRTLRTPPGPSPPGGWAFGWGLVKPGVEAGPKCIGPPINTTNDAAPVGNLDSVDCQANWIGWAADSDLATQSIRVHLYLDGPASGGIDLGVFNANQQSANANTAGYPGNHGFSVPAPPAYKYGNHSVYAYAIGINSSGAEDGNNPPLSSSPRSFNACASPLPTIRCDGNVVFSENERDVEGTLTSNITYESVVDGPPNITITGIVFASNPAGMVLNPIGSTVSPGLVINKGSPAVITQLATFPLQTYIVTATINYSATLVSGAAYNNVQVCTGPVSVYAKPYVKTFGADISTGGSFKPAAGSCAVAPNKSVYGFTRGAGASYVGASSQLGIISLLTVNGFYSASNRSGVTVPPKGLTFSNTAGDTTYGGGFGGNGTCITDYFSDPASNPPNGGTRDPSTASGVFSGSFGAGKHQYTLPGGSILGTLSVPVGSQAAIYVDGNLYINGTGITFAAGAGTRNQMPNLAVIVRGNIYIDLSVTRLDGLYVAQPTDPAAPTNGKIYTCASAFVLHPPTILHGACGNQLSVNGALVAQQIKFQRTRNSLRDTPDGTVETPSFATGAGTNAAEVINFTPEMYIAPTALRDPNDNGTTSKYNAIFSLPPVF